MSQQCHHICDLIVVTMWGSCPVIAVLSWEDVTVFAFSEVADADQRKGTGADSGKTGYA